MIHINSRDGHEMLTQEEFEKKHPGLAAALNAPRPFQAQGEELKGMRQAADMSQREMAKAIGIGLGDLSAMEHGRSEPTQEIRDAYKKASNYVDPKDCIDTEAIIEGARALGWPVGDDECEHAQDDGSCCGSCADLTQNMEEI